MWTKVRNKILEWIASFIGYTFAVIIGATMLLIPFTIVLGCVKLIIMMFGG